jgi:hypothetical protein
MGLGGGHEHGEYRASRWLLGRPGSFRGSSALHARPGAINCQPELGTAGLQGTGWRSRMLSVGARVPLSTMCQSSRFGIVVLSDVGGIRSRKRTERRSWAKLTWRFPLSFDVRAIKGASQRAAVKGSKKQEQRQRQKQKHATPESLCDSTA